MAQKKAANKPVAGICPPPKAEPQKRKSTKKTKKPTKKGGKGK